MEAEINIKLYRGDLPSDVKFQGAVAIDSETTGLSMVRDRLCLIQLGDGQGNAHLVQFEQGAYGCPNLKKLLADNSIEKLFHFARFDLAMIIKFLGVRPSNIYCTRTASRLVRTYTDKHGLKDVCKELLGVDISKQQQSSDWAASELSKEQMEYAASDVMHLHRLKEKFNEMLKREGRMELAKECFEFLPARAELDLIGWAEQDIFAHS